MTILILQAKLQITDPDALIGHQLEESVYGTLIHRLKECKTLGWHRIGRMRRAQWPNNLGRGGYFVERQILAGRLVCDLANDLGKVRKLNTALPILMTIPAPMT